MESKTSISQKVKAFIASLPKEVIGGAKKIRRNDGFGDNILPFELYRNTRQNIERVADQINKSFDFGIYDGCAVLMRRLIEMLLILSFKENKIETEVLGSNGNYLNLSDIINKAIANRTLDLSRNAKEYLDPFREKGNLSAHNPFHNARKKDLELIQPKFRHLVEELFYKSGIFK
ncbi:MAG: hypothetical protein AB1345_14190 [Chloroflexota bacterium]